MNIKLGKKWKSLNESDKQEFIDLASKDRMRYQEDMDEYESNSISLCM